MLYAGDAADTTLEKSGTEALRTVLRFGPETGVHTIGWWRSPQRLKSLLLLTASPDDPAASSASTCRCRVGPPAPGSPPDVVLRPGGGTDLRPGLLCAAEVVIVAAEEAP